MSVKEVEAQKSISMPVSQQTPHPRLRLHRGFESRYLANQRDIVVYLPPGYDEEPHRSYPVLYLQDGQNLFDPRTSFIPGRTWQAREQSDAAIESGQAEPLIIVGIYNTGEHRLSEYTPEPDWKLGGGEADAYGEMLLRELLPFIAGRYRVLGGFDNTGLGGSSLGALVSLYLGLAMSERFGKLAIFSPSVWWNHKSILGYLNERAPELSRKPHIWLDVGDQEGEQALSDAELLARRLAANGWRDGLTLEFNRIPGGTHDELSWAERVQPMLHFLFPAKP